MLRAIVLLAVGVLTGIAAVLFVEGRGPPAGAAGGSSPVAELLSSSDGAAFFPASPRETAVPDTQGGFASQRLAAYASAAAVDDADAVERRIENLAVGPDSLRRDLELEALLTRLAELDSRRAVQLAQSLSIDDRFVVAAFAAAAGTNARDALDELARVRHRGLQRDIALALLDALGDDERMIERIAAALPASLRPSFEIRVLARRAQRDPTAALRAAVRLDDENLRAKAVRDIAASIDATSIDELEALASLLESEDAQLARTFRVSAMARWARNDPAAALDYLERSADRLDASVTTRIVSPAAAADPERLLRLIDRLPADARSNARASAIRAIADRDPLQAIRLFETMPTADRDSVARTIAQSYASRDADAAIAWARSVRQPTNLMTAVIEGIAAVDFDRAVDVVLQELSAQVSGSGVGVTNFPGAPSGVQLSAMPLMTPLTSGRYAAGAAGMTRLADGLLVFDSALGRQALTSMLGPWVQADTERAMAWVLANLTRVPPESLSGVAGRLARVDIESAKRLTDRMPDAARASWVGSVASVLADTSFASAVEWAERFRGEPAYATAVYAILPNYASRDPKAVARLLDESGPAVQAGASIYLVQNWVQQDPAAAARWAATIADESVREQAAVAAIRALRNDPETARRLLQYVTSPAMRQQAEGMIEQGERPPTRGVD